MYHPKLKFDPRKLKFSSCVCCVTCVVPTHQWSFPFDGPTPMAFMGHVLIVGAGYLTDEDINITIMHNPYFRGVPIVMRNSVGDISCICTHLPRMRGP